MEGLQFSEHYDLVTPDGAITSIKKISPKSYEAIVFISDISPAFLGFVLDPSQVFFNIKSTLAQIGINGTGKKYFLDPKSRSAEVIVHLAAYGHWAEKLLEHLLPGAFIGKLFAADERRRVRNADYLLRLFGRTDRFGNPLLSLGDLHGKKDLALEKIAGRTVAFLTLKPGTVSYESTIQGYISTLSKALFSTKLPVRHLLHLHQKYSPQNERKVKKGEMLLVKTLPLHIRTVFGQVAFDLLPKGYEHTTACILEPETQGSGDIYELYGESSQEIAQIPLEFYTLEPFREHVFFSGREQLQKKLDSPQDLFAAFNTAPLPDQLDCSTLVFKGSQLQALHASEWISREKGKAPYAIETYLEGQSCYPFLKSIEEEYIVSQGVLLTRYFPSPLLKKMFLNDRIQRCIKRIYFQIPSKTYGSLFSEQDLLFLKELSAFHIPVFWADIESEKIYQFVPKGQGMFVTPSCTSPFLKSSSFGIHGTVHETKELLKLFEGLLDLQQNSSHPHFHKETPLLLSNANEATLALCSALAQSLPLLFSAHLFSNQDEKELLPFLEAKMTHRDPYVEIPSDFPIFFEGGIEMDKALCSEELKRISDPFLSTPVLLFGEIGYWSQKLASRFQNNLASGALSGKEWIGNCFFCVQNASQALKVYDHYFSEKITLGPEGPIVKEGFVNASNLSQAI